MREPYAPVDELRFERLVLPQTVHAVCPNLACVAQASRPGLVRLTYLEGEAVELESERPDTFHRLDFSPDGRFLLANRSQAWHLESREWVGFPETGQSSSSHAFLFADRLAVAQGSGQVEIFDLCNGERLAPLVPAPEAVGKRVYLSVSSSSDLSRLAITLDKTLYLYDADSDRWEGSWQLEQTLVGATFSPGGRWLVLLAIQSGITRRGTELVKTGKPGKLLFWDRVTRRVAAMADCERQHCFSPRHPLLAMGTPEGVVEVLSMDWGLLRDGHADFERVARIEEQGAVRRLEFIKQGNFLAVTTNVGVGLWKVVTPESTRAGASS